MIVPGLDTRERILTLVDILHASAYSVKEMQDVFLNIYGVFPNRKTLYADLAAIEKHYPLYVYNHNAHGVPRYSLQPTIAPHSCCHKIK